ncbi:MAG: hypothetical protein ACO20H_00410 [Bacteriovoracaceae bacterium]
MISEEKQALQLAVKLLSGQDYAKADLVNKLIKRGFDNDLADTVITKLKEKKLFKEDAFLKGYIKRKSKKGFCFEIIQKELEKKNINLNRDEYDEIIADFNINPNSELKEIMKLKIPSRFDSSDHKQCEKVKNKLLRFALSKGASFDTAVELVDSILNQDG